VLVGSLWFAADQRGAARTSKPYSRRCRIIQLLISNDLGLLVSQMHQQLLLVAAILTSLSYVGVVNAVATIAVTSSKLPAAVHNLFQQDVF
jgi:hypothetical protein